MQKRQEKVVQVWRTVFGALLFAGLCVLSGCSVNAAQLPSKETSTNSTQSVAATSKERMKLSKKDQLEALSGVSYDGTHLKAGVISHGCTSSEDFILEHEVVNSQCRLSIVRTKPDLCRRAPMIAELSFEWSLPDDCIGFELFIANPVLVTNSHGNITKRSK